MRKRSTLLVSLLVAAATAVAASVAVAGKPVTTPDGNAQAIKAVIAPHRLSKTKWTPGSLTVTTTLRNPSASNGVPVPTVEVLIDFDRNTRIFTRGLPTCDPSKVQNVSTEVGRRKCRRAIIGYGKATALIPINGQVFTAKQTVTAFNGTPTEDGKPRIVLQSYGTKPTVTTLVLKGPVTHYNRQGYGPRLELEVPKIAGGAGALTDFKVTINKRWRYRGRPVSFISSKCPRSKRLKVRSVFTFLDGQASKPVDVRRCAQKR